MLRPWLWFSRYSSGSTLETKKKVQSELKIKMHENFRFIEKLFKLNRLIFKKKILLFNVEFPEV